MISQQIGKGSYSTVVAKTGPSSLFALKKVPMDHPYSARFAINEATILRVCNHPNIVRLLRSYTNEKQQVYCLQLEYLGGGTLLGIDIQNNFPLLALWLLQITSALAHLHKKGIVHRDVKLANLMLDDQGCIRLIDFGMSAWQWQVDLQANPTVGSPCYMAPEIFLKLPYNHKVDVYALGVCAYQLIHHCSPYKGSSKREYWSNTLRDKLTFAANCPPEWKILIQSMLQTKPDKRLSIEQVTDYLTTCLSPN